MRTTHSASLCVAGVLALGVTAFAQSAASSSSQTTPSTTATQSSSASSSDQQVTLTGCVQRESDYRSAKDKGRGGAMGTGAGVGNEFILTDASMSSGASSMGSTAAESSATGTSGSSSSASGKDYELTGSGEGEAAQFVGKRVEVTGKLKAAETSASGAPTGGATAGTPPSGVDVASKDLKLREIDVTSVREASGTCPSSVK